VTTNFLPPWEIATRSATTTCCLTCQSVSAVEQILIVFPPMSSTNKPRRKHVPRPGTRDEGSVVWFKTSPLQNPACARAHVPERAQIHVAMLMTVPSTLVGKRLYPRLVFFLGVQERNPLKLRGRPCKSLVKPVRGLSLFLVYSSISHLP